MDHLTWDFFVPCSDLWGAVGGSSLADHWQPESAPGAPHLVSDEVVAQAVQTAGDVGQTQGYLQEQADPGLIAAVRNHVLVDQKLQEDGQVAGGERHQEGTQTAVDDLHTGPTLRAALAGLLKWPDGSARTANHHQRRQQEPKHLQTDDQRRAPALLWKLVEAVEGSLLGLPEEMHGRRDCCEHQNPDRYARRQGHFGWAQLLGFERMTDGHVSVHGYAHDGVDAPVYPHKI